MPSPLASNIPARRTPLIGRATEVAAVCRAFRADVHRLVTLTGAGGSGKTSLAVEAARTLASEVHDGVWFVDLASITDQRELAQACCRVLGISDATRGPEATVREFLARRHSLLLLDNCEHVLAAAAEFANGLLDRCPELRLLATSRSALGIRGEQVLHIAPLAVPAEGRSSPEEVARSPAAELFITRARALRPEVTLETDARAIAEICTILEGLPLAIELAAANVTAMSPAEIADRLARDQRLLVSRDSTRPERQRTMEAAIAWSYDLLSPEEATVLRRMAVLANGWTLTATEQICAFSDVERAGIARIAQRLVESSLIVCEVREESRFRWLQPLREFARRKLEESGEAAAVRTAHEAHYLRVAESLAPRRAGFASPEIVRSMTPEYANVMQAFRAVEARGDVTVALRFHAALLEYWRISGDLRTGLRSMQGLLSMQLPTPARILVLLALADFARVAGEFELARQVSGEAHAMSITENSRFWLRFAVSMRRDIAAAERDFDAARAFADEALPLINPKDTMSLGFWHAARGLVEYEAEDLPAARTHLEQAEQLLPTSEPTWYRGQILSRLGAVARRDGDLPRARTLLSQAVEWLVAYGARVELAEALIELAQVVATEKHPEQAVQFLSFADTLFESTGGRPSTAIRTRRDAAAHELRRKLGPAAFTSAWVSTRSWTLADAADSALARRPVVLPRRASVLDVLTPREREVARLVAEGLTNPQIAERLSISTGTARIHVERILQKLGVASRVHIATAIVGESDGTAVS